MAGMSGSWRVLITGAAGFGGSHLTRALLSRGYGVTGLDVTPPPTSKGAGAWRLAGEWAHPDFRYVWKSVQDIQPADVAGHFAVAHLAAQADAPLAFESPRYTAMQNIDGTVALLEAIRQAGGVDKALFAASGNETGRALYLPIDEEHPLTPHNPYGFSKAAAELAMGAWHRAYGVPSVVMTTGVVAGPGMRREVFIFKWLWNARRGLPIVVEGGRQTRDLAYIDDVVAGWVSALEAPADQVAGQKFYIAGGREHSIEELAVMCRDAMRTAGAGGEAPIEYAGYRPGEEGQREAFSIDKARRVLGYAPRVSAGEAIDLTARWVAGLAAD